MLKIHIRHNSTANVIQAQLSARLDAYFKETTFQFAKPNHTDELRRMMELVYLRKRPLVAVDIEAYERRPKMITELGFAIYDPHNQWLLAQPHIKTVHIISQENRRLLNSAFVPNHKYYFNGATSYQMNHKMLQQYLQHTFQYYFEERQAVLVGHNLAGDIKWLKSHGVASAENTPQVDTQKLFHLSRQKGATLRGILQTVDIPHANLHNAANDAYYTLLAAMAYCDPERRQHFDLDTFAEKSVEDVSNKKLLKDAARKKKFCEKAKVLEEEPPSVNYVYPDSGVDINEPWLIEVKI